MKVLALLLIALCVAYATAQANSQEFPSLVEVEAQVEGPDNNILNGKPLRVPIIVDPFAQAPGTDAAETLDRITQVLTMEPPAAAEPAASPIDEVDVLEVLDVAASKKKKRALKKAKKTAKKAAKKAASTKKGKTIAGLNKKQVQGMSAVKAEMKTLSKLISKAQKIQTELPKKKARLEALKKKLHSAATKTAKTLASKKAGKQVKVAKDVESKINLLKDKLAKLESAKKLLTKSISGLKKVASGKKTDPKLVSFIEEQI